MYKILQDNLVESNMEELEKDENNKYWVILTPEEINANNNFFHFSYQTIYDCIHNEDTPKLDVYDSYSFGILNIIGPNESFFSVSELNFYITKKYLVFISDKYLDLFREIQNDIYSKGLMGISTEKILYNLIDKMTLKDYSMLSNLETEISSVEEDVLKGKTKDYIKDIVLLKNKLLFLKKHYEPLMDVVENLTENENSILDKKSIAYFVILLNRIERLNRKVGNLRDYVTQIRESYQAQLDINLNNIMKLFTVLTAIFSPLTFIVGWYGMNFSSMPELHWKYGYMFVIILSMSTLAFCLWIFKKKKLW
ncbi:MULTISPECIES: magnesium transporter CorA family protein [unclassified Sedimentibacter]|uniref:magnesium transporter CorA family protein n=1 Tax=unclassified Sedimentibacter TaxID=2649220 RepID=UPI0027E0FC3B|nr:CorA family divalent cation transporter [Sedimentibacter sp. MB35-C1]WMJ79011.1 CorA family divalent cation transporter [Sedimentibacter sp. MB35-C1]